MKRSRIRLIPALALGLALLMVGGAARALDPMCDIDLWSKMHARAHIHTHMDSVTVQNLVYKPDSVLEYTCFDRFLDVATNSMSYYFTSSYTNTTIRNGVQNYLSNNFGPTFLGGRMANPGGTASGSGYVCDAMSKVWEGWRCLNFANECQQDHFYTLTVFLNANDIRRYPDATCSKPAMGSFGVVPVQGTTLNANTPVNAADCGAAIRTGYKVNVPIESGETRSPQYDEYVCINPTCNYNPASNSCVPG